MSLAYLMPVSLGVFVLALIMVGVSTRRVCQRCDYCARFYWWIGWSAFEWTSPACQYWMMRCRHCRWLTRQLRPAANDAP
jgi:hypothetical protein